MIKKIFSLAFISIFVFIWFAYSSNYKTSIKIDLVYSEINSIYNINNNFENFKIWYNSNIDISKYRVSSNCKITTKFLNKESNIYYFDILLKSKNCKILNIYLLNENNKRVSKLKKYNIINYNNIINILIEYPNDYLENLLINWKLNKNNALHNIIENILEKRKQLYSTPVYWYSLPTRTDKLPNSPRPYRQDYTFWIHEWWDIDTSFKTPIISIDDGIIIRIIDNFKFDDLNKIKKWDDLTTIDKYKNLDILRWNQIWLKTMKWDIIFYSHLDKIFSDIQVGNFVKKETPIWTIWISWIPDKNYNDYHLHFELRKNPNNLKNIWKNIYLDYMSWDWYFKDKSIDYIIANQYSIFKKN